MAAADIVGMAFIPYYNHLMEILQTNKELEKTAKGKKFDTFGQKMSLIVTELMNI